MVDQKLDFINKTRRTLILAGELKKANDFCLEAMPPKGTSFKDLDNWQGHWSFLLKLAKKYDALKQVH